MRSWERRASSERILWAIAGLLLVTLVVVAWLQNRWLSQLHAAQVERRVAALSGELEALRESFDRRFFGWALEQEMILAQIARDPDQRPERFDDLEGTVIDRMYRRQLDAADSGWWRLLPDGSSMPLEQPALTSQLPPGASSLVPIAISPQHLMVILAEVLPTRSSGVSQATAHVDGETGSLRSTGPVMLVTLDRRRFMERLLIPAVEAAWPGLSADLDVVLVERGEGGEALLYGSKTSLLMGDSAESEGEVRLLRPEAAMNEASRLAEVQSHDGAGACPECLNWAPVGLGFLAGDPPERQWLLRVRTREGSMTRVIDQLRARNVWISLSGVLLIGSAIVLLVVLAGRAQRLARTRMEFVSSVSHELRTPLSVIGSAASNLAGGWVDHPQQVRRYGELLNQETRRLRELVERVLTFARLDEGGLELAEVDIAAVVERVVTAHRDHIEQRALELELELPAELPAVRANATALESAMRNLLDNAIQHGGDGGRVRIEAVVEQADPAPELRLSVRDWGAGVDTAERKRLFDPFFRGRRAREHHIPGTGLGLSLVAKIATALGGRVRARTGLRSGAAFDLFLPLAATSASAV